DHTGSRVQSAKRREQVLPQFISDGKACRGMPVLKTKMMPVKALCYDARGRPLVGDGAASGGSNGSICCRNSSRTSSLMRVSPCITVAAEPYLIYSDCELK